MADLVLKHLKKTYDAKQVLHGVDVTIPDGSFVVMVGPSGCGKSTLLRMIAGLEDINEGTLTIGGVTMNDIDPADRGCAMVFQNYALYPHMTVRQNIGYPLKIAKMPAAERDRRIQEAAAILNLTDYLDRRPAQLSGGQRQRVAMGRAIVREPEVFLFDEPLSNLDALLRVQMRIEIKRLHKRLKATSIFVTHDQVEAMTLADMLIVMNAGRIEQVGTPAEVYRKPASVFVAGFMGSPAMNLMEATMGADGQVTLDVAGGRPMLRLAGLAEGTPLTVGVRPEAITLMPEGADGLQATVELVEELGGSRIAYCALKGSEIAVVLPPGDEPYEGRQVTLSFDQRDLHLFDRITGLRVEIEPSRLEKPQRTKVAAH
ncbi:sn-glycerol-3-phosphate ABC transporter ATP-binding protein UgpC [Devosia sp. XJ19-1]|uniref:Sn-glycerol-3-phosphate ABC transporter ATP-binding protein UgpC n=1 Tax=Devosia ureilytica TaxID=2952754 RepID=A0A9Q4FRR7_9HYPH|nr:sn-glycerol-3-phosphate ABC transporter ATP-binding protein UgpC [Devosia ureilytica]MCP8884143.1 sn-glycerol-3-phosphate ABC transporter ATP-binding protein UgpC [Devosia ureilytica]MCP8887751.1 sn-glycerol-3-phosphate ABC transporter ATP-binding protein UgpC [Devosia ureilytica]